MTLTLAVTWMVVSSRPMPRAANASAVAPPAPHALYHPDPNHIWNRVDAHLRVRVANGRAYGADAVDPLLWRSTRYLLTGPSHATALALLDEFFESNAERLVTDPVRRAVFQRDVWAVFDWTVAHSEAHAAERRALAGRLARVIRSVALTAGEAAKLPDTYEAVARAGLHPTEYDRTDRKRAFLPPQLWDPAGPWVAIHGITPLPQHSDELSRSTFAVLLSVPGGRAATLKYLKGLWDAPEPFVIDRSGSFGGERRTMMNPALHRVQEGTGVALIRRMLLIDASGEIRRTNIVESVQLRVFRPAEPLADPRRRVLGGHNDQDFYEFVLDRAGLLSSAARGLRALRPSEEGFLTFSSHGIDAFEDRPPGGPGRIRTLEMCVACHSAPGLASVLSVNRLLKPHASTDAGGPAGSDMAEFWKARRADWGQLQAYWDEFPGGLGSRRFRF